MKTNKQNAKPRACVDFGDPESTAILVWHYRDAPVELKFRYDDVDWIAFIPREIEDEYYPWMEEGSAFGCCDVSEHKITNGTVRIGMHS